MGIRRALVIDDDRALVGAVREHLAAVVDDVVGACDPEEGLRRAARPGADVILLDVNMPRLDGFKVCRHLKEAPATRDVPVLFLTVERDARNLARALACGAADYIRKPVNPVELQARVAAALRNKRMIDLLREQARIDALTGLQNRVAFEEAIRAATAAFERKGRPMALLFMDLDTFKQVNDSHGHGVGDELLRAVGGVLRRSCRPYDVPSRYGGDEFAVVLGHTHGAEAEGVAQRVLSAVAGAEVKGPGGLIRAAASAGLVSTPAGPPGALDPGALLQTADEALYRAKNAGGGRVEVAEPPAPRAVGPT